MVNGDAGVVFLRTSWYRGGICGYFLIQRWHLWVHGEWWYRGGIAMGTTSAAPSLWIKAAPCLHQKLIHPHHFCPFKLLSLLPALNYLMPSSSILLLENCVIFIRWISSIRRPRVIPSLSHTTFFIHAIYDFQLEILIVESIFEQWQNCLVFDFKIL